MEWKMENFGHFSFMQYHLIWVDGSIEYNQFEIVVLVPNKKVPTVIFNVIAKRI